MKRNVCEACLYVDHPATVDVCPFVEGNARPQSAIGGNNDRFESPANNILRYPIDRIGGSAGLRWVKDLDGKKDLHYDSIRLFVSHSERTTRCHKCDHRTPFELF